MSCAYNGCRNASVLEEEASPKSETGLRKMSQTESIDSSVPNLHLLVGLTAV